jgi:Uma2 family endonuclease
MPDDYEPPHRVTYEEYLRLEQELAGKYEYHAGLMYPRQYPPGSHWAMAGGTVAHAQLIVSVLTALRVHLGNRGPCRFYPSDMKLKVAAHDYYPDAYVTCEQTRPRQAQLEDAILICEVRSQSTAEFDRGDKFEAFQHLPSLGEYLILDNRRPRATLFQKVEDGAWTYLTFSAGATIPLTTIGLDLAVDAIYEGVTLDPDPTSAERADD